MVFATVVGDGFDGHVGASAGVRCADTGRRGDGRFGDVIRVVGRVDLSYARIATANQAFELNGHGDLLVQGRTRDGVVGQRQGNRGDAVGTREGDELVFGGEGRVVTRFAQRVFDGLVIERTGPRRSHPCAAGTVIQDPNAESIGRSGGEFFYFALVGLDLGIDTAGDVDLDLLATVRRLQDAFRQLQKLTHAAAPPMVTLVRRIVA